MRNKWNFPLQSSQVGATEDPHPPCSEKIQTLDKDIKIPRVFIERNLSDFSESKPDYRSRVNSLGHNLGHFRPVHNNINNNELDLINSKLSKTQDELDSLKIAHGKLQKVLSEKASELSHAVRKAEVYEREAKKLRYKLDEARRQQRQDRLSSEKDRASISVREKIGCEKRRNTSDSSIANNITKQNVEKPSPEEISTFVKILNEDIYDEVEERVASSKSLGIEVKNIYDVPKVPLNADEKDALAKYVSNKNVSQEDKSAETQNFEVIKNHSDDNNKTVKDDNQNSDESSGNQAIYATVNLEMKKNSKRQKDCSNGNLLISEKENLVAII